MARRVSIRRHALKRMRERQITTAEVCAAVENGKEIETYPAATPHPRRLLSWSGPQGPLHVVVAEPEDADEVLVITVYRPGLDRWYPGFRRRR